MTKTLRFFCKPLCLFLSIVACFTVLTACNEFEEEEEPETKTYELGNLAFISAADAEDNPTIATWLENCRENSVESIKIFCLTSYDEENLTSVYLFYLPNAKTNVSVNAKIITNDYKKYTAYIDFTSGDEACEQDVIYYLKTEVVRPSILQNNVTLNGQSGVMMMTQAQAIIDIDAVTSNTDVQ